ncbi:hypothetical protein [Methylosinus sp. Ce-a6]|uniref:hypothetical protein n=1 Tax=Methylosinus sp. Ce-a6 TaxID=2172005 RepID=UPI0013583663|nr:hypothetical protein [Methylosinus sp. Ce-a6]
MVRRTARSDAYVDKDRLLGELRACRAAVIREQARMRVGGPLYYSGQTVVAAIDGLALMLAGNGQYFWEPMRTGQSDKSAESGN